MADDDYEKLFLRPLDAVARGQKYWREIDPVAYAFIVLELCRDLFQPCPP